MFNERISQAGQRSRYEIPRSGLVQCRACSAPSSRAYGRQATKVYSGRGSRHCYAIIRCFHFLQVVAQLFPAGTDKVNGCRQTQP
jgi:hypothetical protein